MPLQLVEFFFLTPVGLTVFGFLFCIAFFSGNADLFFFKIFVSYLLEEIIFLNIFLKTKIIREKVVKKYGMQIQDQIDSLNTALFYAFITILTIFVIDFLTLFFSVYLKKLEVQALGDSVRKLIEIAPENQKSEIADRYLETLREIYKENTKGLIRKIFSTLFGNEK